MNSRFIIAAGDITSSPVLARHFRGKTAKETYRCAKGIILTRSIAKPVGFAILQIPAEFSKGVVYTAIGQVGESVLGYISGVGFVRYLYKVVEPKKFKATCRLAYNIACLPLTLYYKRIGGAFDFLQLSRLEKMWFGQPVYIFEDNRLWVEGNFTLGDIFEQIE
jgi:hypothetical protein